MTRVERFSGAPESWDLLAAEAAGGTHFHQFGWLRVIEQSLHHEVLPLAAVGATGLVEAVLPLVRVRTPLFGHYLVSVPFVNYGGPIGSDAGIRALVEAAVALARRDRVKLLELRSARPLPVALPVSHRKVTVVLDLPDDPERLFGAFPAKLRSQIRRPGKAGVEVRRGPEQLASFYAVFAEHMRDLGTPVMPRRWFEAVAAAFPASMECAVAWYRGEPVAAGIGFRWRGEFELTWAAALRRHQELAANMLLYWDVLEAAVAAGCHRFNFGRCTPGGGTHRFKRQWGGGDEALWWYQDSAAGVDATPAPDRGALALGPRLWKHLPLAVANRLGPAIVRGIP